MTGLEELVRESLAAQVAEQPSLYAPADRAIRRARRVRRRRTLVGGCVAVVVLVVAGTVATRPGAGTGGTTSPEPVAGVSGTDAASLPVLTDPHRLQLPDGRAVDLGTRGARGGYRVPDGWLVYGLGPGGWLALVDPDGGVHDLLDGVPALVVGKGGRQFAWTTGTTLKTGHLAGDVLVVDHSTAAPAEAVPVAMTDTAVALSGSWAGDVERRDVWLPAQGAYTPGWGKTAPVVNLFGPAPDGRTFVGLVGDPQGGPNTCLALLDPADHLHATRTTCGFYLDATTAVPQLSPDGRWLAVELDQPGVDARTAVIDLSTVFTPARQQPQTWSVWPPRAWLDDSTLIAGHGGQGYRLRLGQDVPEALAIAGVPAQPEWLQLPAGARPDPG